MERRKSILLLTTVLMVCSLVAAAFSANNNRRENLISRKSIEQLIKENAEAAGTALDRQQQSSAPTKGEASTLLARNLFKVIRNAEEQPSTINKRLQQLQQLHQLQQQQQQQQHQGQNDVGDSHEAEALQQYVVTPLSELNSTTFTAGSVDDDESNTGGNVDTATTVDPSASSAPPDPAVAAAAAGYELKNYFEDPQRRSDILSGQAEIINSHLPDQYKTLDELYPLGPGGTVAYNPQQVVLQYVQFARDYSQWNPRSNDSQWQWLEDVDTNAGAKYPADHGHITVGGAGNDGESASDTYSQQLRQQQSKDYVMLQSIPFVRWWPNDKKLATLSPYEAFVVRKQPLNITRSQKLMLRMKMSCREFGVERHPFPPKLVRNARDDYRLATCIFQVLDMPSGMFFQFHITNKAVWAIYGRGPVNGNNNGNNNNYNEAQTFIARRRIAQRRSFDDVVDAGILCDAKQRLVRYYINGILVWTVPVLGHLPSFDNGITTVDVGRGVPQFATLTQLRVGFGTAKLLDETDPNAPSNSSSVSPRLVRVRNDQAMYGANDVFYDSQSKKSNNLWGQAAVLKLFKLLIVLDDEQRSKTWTKSVLDTLPKWFPAALLTTTTTTTTDAPLEERVNSIISKEPLLYRLA